MLLLRQQLKLAPSDRRWIDAATLHFKCKLWKPTSALFWVSDSVGLQPPTASDLRQRRTSTSDSIGPPTASDFISDSVGVLSPTALDFYLRQRRTCISDSVGLHLRQRRTGLQSPTASDFNLQQLASRGGCARVIKRHVTTLTSASYCIENSTQFNFCATFSNLLWNAV